MTMNINSLFGVKGKVVLVTGGGRGIGLMIAQGFVENGAKVYISSRSKDVCDKVAEELTKKGPGECISIPADLQSVEDIKKLVAELSKREKALNILVNNAGANWAAPLEQYPDNGFGKVLSLNLHRVFTMTQACMPLLLAAATPEDPARVINIGSIDGIRPPKFETYAYSASKAGLNHLTKHLAFLHGHRHVTFNTVAPGPFESKMMQATLDAFKDLIVDGVPLGRIGRPEDMAG
ncbi:hypothetical protein HK102_008038, partial [Quaeritorhiza haematococci]